jgi:hypothetical protein
MVSSAEEAILVIKKWRSKSARIRMVLGSSHARITLHGYVCSIEDLSVVCVGSEPENELRFDLSSARSIHFADERGLPKGFEFFKPLIVDDLMVIVFENDTGLILLNETPSRT